MAQLNSTIINGNLAVAEDVAIGGNLVLDNNLRVPGTTTVTDSILISKTLDAAINIGIAVNQDNDNYFLRCKNGGVGKFSVGTTGNFWAAGTGSISGNIVVTGNAKIGGSSGATLSYDSSKSNLESNKQIKAPSFYATSDMRLKENIIVYKPEKSILDLPIYKFDFIDGPKNKIGCLAQDLQEICPEIVQESSDGYLSIEESKIVYLLLDEVKKLKAEVEALKK